MRFTLAKIPECGRFKSSNLTHSFSEKQSAMDPLQGLLRVPQTSQIHFRSSRCPLRDRLMPRGGRQEALRGRLRAFSSLAGTFM